VVEKKVVELHAAHRDWGKHRLAHDIAKGNNWVALVSPNTVRRILTDAGGWNPAQNSKKKDLANGRSHSRHARADDQH
jgi:hypothetical protein